jgi:Tfp pilus assembly protein PilZ
MNIYSSINGSFFVQAIACFSLTNILILLLPLLQACFVNYIWIVGYAFVSCDKLHKVMDDVLMLE